MDEAGKQLLLELLAHGYDKGSWHGANLKGALRGVQSREAAQRVGKRKTIWEQALHSAYWKQRVINKLAGTQKFGRKGSNWPEMPTGRDETAWREDLALLEEIHRRLLELVRSLDVRQVDEKVVRMIHGVAFHDVYHAGQIKLLRRMGSL